MKRLLFFVFAAAVFIGGYMYWRNLPHNALPRITHKLVERANIESTLTLITAVSRAKGMTEYFDESVLLKTPYPEVQGEFSHEDFTTYFATFASRAAYASFSVSDVSVEDFDSTTGEVSALLKISVDAMGERITEMRETEFTFRKGEDGWKVSQLTMGNLVEE